MLFVGEHHRGGGAAFGEGASGVDEVAVLEGIVAKALAMGGPGYEGDGRCARVGEGALPAAQRSP